MRSRLKCDWKQRTGLCSIEQMNSCGSSTLCPPMTYRLPFNSQMDAECLAMLNRALKVIHWLVAKSNYSTTSVSTYSCYFRFKNRSMWRVIVMPPAATAMRFVGSRGST